MLSLRDSMHIFVRIRTTQKRLDGHFVCILAHTVLYTSCYTRIQTRSRSRVYRDHAIPCIYTCTHIYIHKCVHNPMFTGTVHIHTHTYMHKYVDHPMFTGTVRIHTHTDTYIYTNMLITLCLLALCDFRCFFGCGNRRFHGIPPWPNGENRRPTQGLDDP